jgi:hypothetical protein
MTIQWSKYRTQQPTPQQRTARIEQALERSYFPVEKIQTGSDKYAIIRKDTGQKLSDVSKRYTLVRNYEVFNPFIQHFGADKVKKFYGYGNSKYYYLELDTGRSFNFGTDTEPDEVNERLIIQNSYNKTRSFSFMLGAFRWVCSNGLYTGEAIVSYKKIHTGYIPTTELVYKALCRYTDNSFDTWKQLKEKPLTLDEELEIVEGFEAKELKEETKKDRWNINNQIKYTARRRIERETSIDNQRNGWGLLNGVNWSIARNLYGSSKTSERITANKRLENYLVEKVLN